MTSLSLCVLSSALPSPPFFGPCYPAWDATVIITVRSRYTICCKQLQKMLLFTNTTTCRVQWPNILNTNNIQLPPRRRRTTNRLRKQPKYTDLGVHLMLTLGHGSSMCYIYCTLSPTI